MFFRQDLPNGEYNDKRGHIVPYEFTQTGAVVRQTRALNSTISPKRAPLYPYLLLYNKGIRTP